MEQFDYKYEMKKIIIISAILLFAAFVFFHLWGWNFSKQIFKVSENYIGILFIAVFICTCFIIIWDMGRTIRKKEAGFSSYYYMSNEVKQKDKLKLAQLILPVACIAIGACIGSFTGDTMEKKRIAQRVAEEETEEKVEDEYEDIGEAVVYQTLLSDKNELDDEPSSANYHLFMKSHGGENFYYLGFYNGSKKYLLEKGSWTKKGMHFNARYYYSPFYFYTNVSAWSSSGSSSGGSTRVIHDDSPRAVQEWVPCPVCGYSGRVGLCQHCNGTGQDLYYTREYRDCPNCGGLKRCPNCGGNGGHYETRYR